jgi:hypothetical protein
MAGVGTEPRGQYLSERRDAMPKAVRPLGHWDEPVRIRIYVELTSVFVAFGISPR